MLFNVIKGSYETLFKQQGGEGDAVDILPSRAHCYSKDYFLS